MERRELVRNLMIMAASDGQLTQREIELLADRCDAWGIDEDEFSEIVAEALADRSQLTLPTTPSAREELLGELIHMMAADGRLSESEKSLFAIFAVAMDFSQEEIQTIIDRTIEQPCDES
jgi:uncharacterized tellurite resistance protein B-like protein